MKRDYIETELGTEARCAKCLDFWPVDKEFYFFDVRGRPHSWCKACYTADRVAKGKRRGYGTQPPKQDHARCAA